MQAPTHPCCQWENLGWNRAEPVAQGTPKTWIWTGLGKICCSPVAFLLIFSMHEKLCPSSSPPCRVLMFKLFLVFPQQHQMARRSANTPRERFVSQRNICLPLIPSAFEAWLGDLLTRWGCGPCTTSWVWTTHELTLIPPVCLSFRCCLNFSKATH